MGGAALIERKRAPVSLCSRSPYIRVYNDIILQRIAILTRARIIDDVDMTKLDRALCLVQSCPVCSVLHAAGAIRDALVANVEMWMAHVTLGAKSSPLSALVGEACCFCLVLFSSVAAEMGTPGQVGYAHANGKLDDFAAVASVAGIRAASV